MLHEGDYLAPSQYSFMIVKSMPTRPGRSALDAWECIVQTFAMELRKVHAVIARGINAALVQPPQR